MRTHWVFFLILLPYFACAQLYEDLSPQLPEAAMMQSMDIRCADIDLDGDQDIVLANEFQSNTLLVNNGNGQFTEASVLVFTLQAHDSEDVAIADFNLDGFPDLIFCSEDDINLGVQEVHEYYLGDGTGGFSLAPYVFPDSEANAVIAADLNNDSYPDVLFGNAGQNRLFINQGDGSFIEETDSRLPTVNRTTQDLLVADIDGDSDPDLLEGNENGNKLYINDGNGFFSDETADRLPDYGFVETRKISVGDINLDGFPDLFLSNVNFLPGKNPQNRLYLNDGTGNFSDISATALPPDQDLSLDALFVHLTQDAYPDLIVANVFGGPCRAYFNNGDNSFKIATSEVFPNDIFLDALGLFEADLDGDELPDLYICDRNTGSGNTDRFLRRTDFLLSNSGPVPDQIRLFPNPATDEIWVQMNLRSPVIELTLTDSTSFHIKPLFSVEPEGVRIQIPPGIPTGWYTLHLRTSEDVLNAAVLIVKN